MQKYNTVKRLMIYYGNKAIINRSDKKMYDHFYRKYSIVSRMHDRGVHNDHKIYITCLLDKQF